MTPDVDRLVTIMDEAAAAKNRPWYGEHKGDWAPLSHRELATAIADALRSQSPEPSSSEVRVKPLEWHADDDGLHLVSHTVAGRYAVTEYPGMEQPFRLYCPTWMERKPFNTLNEAKAAAQADYEQRILSTLSPTVSQPVTGDIADETEILRRLADGDAIVYSQDGDDCWFSKGDRAHVAEKAVLSLREKGHIERRVDADDDTDNYRGMAEYDAISPAGREALTTITGGENEG